MSKKVATTVYITPEQQELLKILTQRSKVPIAEYIRQGIDLVAAKYEHLLPGQLELSDLPLGTAASEDAEKIKSIHTN